MNKEFSLATTFQRFLVDHSEFLENPIVKDFLKAEGHLLLLANAINNPTENNNKKLDEAFRIHYFTIRFTSYISSSMFFSAINFNKKQAIYKSRYPLILDKEMEAGEAMTYKEIVVDTQSDIELCMETNYFQRDVLEYVADPFLFNAIKTMTKFQKEILYCAYVCKLNDTEIATKINKSQQYISKVHKEALKNIYHLISRKKEGK